MGQDKSTGVDAYGIAMSVMPMTVAEYYAMQDTLQGESTGAPDIDMDDKKTTK